MTNIKTIWSEEDECYIATIEESDLIGCGDTEEEAIEHLQNHLEDEQETPRKKNKKNNIIPGSPRWLTTKMQSCYKGIAASSGGTITQEYQELFKKSPFYFLLPAKPDKGFFYKLCLYFNNKPLAIQITIRDNAENVIPFLEYAKFGQDIFESQDGICKIAIDDIKDDSLDIYFGVNTDEGCTEFSFDDCAVCPLGAITKMSI